MDLNQIVSRIQNFNGNIKIMEVCGTHTSSVFRHGIRSLTPPGVRLVSGPGCPVCVTPRADIDALVRLSGEAAVCCFGDMLRVPGSEMSLAEAKARGGDVRMVYSPFDVLKFAANEPHRRFVLAAVGFETTAPAYAALVEEMAVESIHNVSLFTSLKTIPEAMEYICETEGIDAFICPGHVAAVIGAAPFTRLCEKYRKPFVIAGFEAEHILAAIYAILRMRERGACEHVSNDANTNHSQICDDSAYKSINFYPSVVKPDGQGRALAMIDKYFVKTDAYWRGIGVIRNSGYALRKQYAAFDADGGHAAYGMNTSDDAMNEPNGCRCADVLLGRIDPDECALFGSACTPDNPIGACMVTSEGACGIWANML